MKLKKSLGQNFLKDIFYLDKIITSSQINKTKNVVEIGPGDGALTGLILQNSNHLKAFIHYLKDLNNNPDFEKWYFKYSNNNMSIIRGCSLNLIKNNHRLY